MQLKLRAETRTHERLPSCKFCGCSTRIDEGAPSTKPCVRLTYKGRDIYCVPFRFPASIFCALRSKGQTRVSPCERPLFLDAADSARAPRGIHNPFVRTLPPCHLYLHPSLTLGLHSSTPWLSVAPPLSSCTSHHNLQLPCTTQVVATGSAATVDMHLSDGHDRIGRC
jgi:hypothetical protein